MERTESDTTVLSHLDPAESTHFAVVGVGGSAGGLEAFKELLRNLSPKTGMAFVFIQHLAPEAASNLTEILSRETSMTVETVAHGMTIKPNCVYVMPPNKLVSETNREFHLRPRAEGRGVNLPIDDFLVSISKAEKSGAIGVILSGLGSDGSLGARAVNAEGGIVLAQDQQTAQFPSMPTKAIETGCVDFILSPKEIALELDNISKHPIAQSLKRSSEKKNDSLHSCLVKIFYLVRKQCQVDFTHYKQTTVRRRIQRRLTTNNLDTIDEYLDLLNRDPQEVAALADDLLIKVTHFFRDKEVFVSLNLHVFPKILKSVIPGTPIRIWVTGCSTGEEAYSIGIAFLEYLSEMAHESEIQIFATDVSEHAVKAARAGLYPESITKHVSPERLRRFFIKTEHGYQVRKAVRDMCVFAVQNIISDPPFSRIDLISCRNMLIYFSPLLQKKVIPTLHYGLKEDAFLLLGSSETVGSSTDHFKIIDKKNKIFEKKLAPMHRTFDPLQDVFESTTPINYSPQKKAIKSIDVHDVLKRSDRIVLNKLAPAGVVINEDLEILQIRGDTNNFLGPAPGLPSFNLLKMTLEELRTPLRILIQEAKKTNLPQSREGLRIKDREFEKSIAFQVLPFKLPSSPHLYFIIGFTETLVEIVKGTPSNRPKISKVVKDQMEDDLSRLTQELSESRAYLQATIEDLETANEELKSSNEEVLSNNEELQSTNEELQTAKEEVQSTNEELITLNEEVQNRNVELVRINDDMNNLLSSTTIPVVMLGKDSRIRRFTPNAKGLLNLISADIGRPISDITPTFKLANLKELVMEVMESALPIQKDLQDKHSKWFTMDIHPYRTSENKIDGVVIAFADITSRKKEERKINLLLESSPVAMVVSDQLGKISLVNSAAEICFGYKREELLSQNIEIFVPERSRKVFETLQSNYISSPYSHLYERGMEVVALRKDGTEIDVELSLRSIESDDGLLIAAAIKNISPRRENEIKRLAYQKKLVSKFRALLESAPNPMVVINQEGTIQIANTAAERLFGYDDNELEGNSDEVLIPKRFHKKHLQHRLKSTKSTDSRPIDQGENIIFGIKKDGTEFPGDFRLSPIQIDEETVISCSIQDLSDQKKTEKVLVDAKIASEMANQAKGEFLANMSHEIRTPLTSIIGFSQKIAEHSLSSEDRLDAVQIIKRNANHLQQLINDVLDLSKVESGKMDIEKVEFSLTDDLAELWLIFSRHTAAKSLKIEFLFEGPIPETIISDPTRFRQILSNILGNAIKFTKRGGIQLLIKLIPGPKKSKRLQILVKDSGIGIDKDVQKRIFSPFIQADSSITRKFGGTGLGLILSRHLADALGGVVELVESTPKKGSVFSIVIDPGPLKGVHMIENLTQSKLSVAKQKADEINHKLLDGIKILFVEDSPDIQVLVKAILENVGAKVTIADNGEIGVSKAEAGSFDIVFMDMQMPVLDGLEATKMLRLNDYSKPIVGLTAGVMKEEIKRCIKAGCNEVVAKPINFSTLFDVVVKHTKN